MAMMAPPPLGGELSKPPSSRLQRTGALISGGGSHRSTGSLRSTGSQTHLHQYQPPPSQRSERSVDSGYERMHLGPPEPPPERTGIMQSTSVPTLEPYAGPAMNVATLKKAHMQRAVGPPDGMPKAVWSDSNMHLGGEDPWPHHAVPLWVFSGKDRPRPAYREEVRFTLRDDTYINFAVRMRCGKGDHYNGGTVGIIHRPDRSEAMPGSDGQLIMVTDVTVQPNNTVVVSAIGDVGFKVKKAWMPRALRGLQLAHIEVESFSSGLDPIIETCSVEPSMTLFARMLQAAPRVAELLASEGPFTLFVPTNEAFANLGMSEAELLQRPDLETLLSCHIIDGKVPFEAMYSGRTLRAVDGTILQMTFARWPRRLPSVNELPVESLDVMCTNGVIHSIAGLLSPSPAPGRRRR